MSSLSYDRPLGRLSPLSRLLPTMTDRAKAIRPTLDSKDSTSSIASGSFGKGDKDAALLLQGRKCELRPSASATG